MNKQYLERDIQLLLKNVFGGIPKEKLPLPKYKSKIDKTLLQNVLQGLMQYHRDNHAVILDIEEIAYFAAQFYEVAASMTFKSTTRKKRTMEPSDAK